MPNNCSAPGCKSNYDPTDRIPVFKMPQKPDELRHAWLRALHRDDIDELKVVYVCSKHFREDEVQTTHKVPNGDGSYREIPRNRPKLKYGAVPTILPGCPRYYSSHTATKRTRLCLEDKDDELLYQSVKLSLESDVEENDYSRSTVSMIYKLSYPYSQLLVYGLRGIPTNNINLYASS